MPVRRPVVRIDESRCNGCGACVLACAEAAIRIVDGKARLLSEVLCDGFGACLGECPEGAIAIEEREAEAFSEEAVRDRLADLWVQTGCPSAQPADLREASGAPSASPASPGPLPHWPIKLRLVPPGAPFLRDADLVLIADCVPFADPDFYRRTLPGCALLIGCPKFEDYDAALGRLTEILRESRARSLTVVHMEVPCCAGYWHLGREALKASGSSAPLKQCVVGVAGGECSAATEKI